MSVVVDRNGEHTDSEPSVMAVLVARVEISEASPLVGCRLYGAQVAQHGEHATIAVGRFRNVELLQHTVDVGFDRAR